MQLEFGYGMEDLITERENASNETSKIGCEGENPCLLYWHLTVYV